SRAELPRGSSDVVAYSITVSERGKELELQRTESSASDQVSDPHGAHAIGKSRRMHVDLSPGRHALALAVNGSSAILVRLHQSAAAHAEEPMVTLTPIEATRSVSVIENEKTIPYSTVTDGHPVKLRVEGPGELELITRLEFDSSMRGT